MRGNTPPAILVGAGPAGVSAALVLHSIGVPFRLLEHSDRVGGTLNRVYNPIAIYPGQRYENGAVMADALARQLHDEHIDVEFGASVTRIDPSRQQCFVDGEAVPYGTLLLGTGTRAETLGIPGEQRLQGHGIAISANVSRDRNPGGELVIIGGGDAAFEDALILSSRFDHIHIVHRRLPYRARPAFVARVKALPNVTFHQAATAMSFEGEDRLTGVTILTSEGPTLLPADEALVRIGVLHTEPDGLEELTRGRRGYLDIDRHGRTSDPHIYAAGDVCNERHQTVAGAAGQGSNAAWSMAGQLGYLVYGADRR